MNSKKSLSVKLFLLISLFCFAFASLMLVLPNNTETIAYATAQDYEASWNGSTFTWVPSQPSEINAGDTLYVTSDKTSNTVICSYDNENITAHKIKPLLFKSEHRYSVAVQSNTITLTRLSYSVKYDGNGATSGSAPDSTEYAQNASVTVLGNTGSLENTGYAFAGWNTQANGEGTDYAVGSNFTMPATDITLYAQWEVAKATISIDDSIQRFIYDGTAKTPVLKDTSGNAITLGGFNYSYQMHTTELVDCSDTKEPGLYRLNITRVEDADYSAVNTYIEFVVSYSLTYNANTGVGEDVIDDGSDNNINKDYFGPYVDTDTYEFDKQAIIQANTFTKENYTFAFWNTKQDGTGTAYNADNLVTLTGNTILYACYSANISVQPINTNDYTVSVATTDTVTYQWEKEIEVETPVVLADTTVNLGNKNSPSDGFIQAVDTSGTYKITIVGTSVNNRLRFYSEGTLNDGVTGVDNVYTYNPTVGKAIFYIITSNSPFSISNIYYVSSAYTEVSGETASSIQNANENTSYRCAVKSGFNAVSYSSVITPKAISFVGGDGATGTAPSTQYQLEGRTITIPSNTFEKTGYDFIGWNTDS